MAVGTSKRRERLRRATVEEIHAAARKLLVERGPAAVTVNAVAPAATRTPVMDDTDPEQLRAAAAAIPVGRFGRAEEVAGLVGYLCGEDAGFITGATFDVNGGVFMR